MAYGVLLYGNNEKECINEVHCVITEYEDFMKNNYLNNTNLVRKEKISKKLQYFYGTIKYNLLNFVKKFCFF